MAAALVNTTSAQHWDGSTATTLSTSAYVLTAGNLSVVVLRLGSAISLGDPAVSDTAGNVYHFDGLAAGGRFAIWSCANCLGHATNVVTVTHPARSFTAVTAVQFSGAPTTIACDFVSANVLSGATVSCTPFSASTDQIVVVGSDLGNSGLPTIGPSGTFTNLYSSFGPPGVGSHRVAYNLNTTQIFDGSVTVSGTFANTTNQKSVFVAIFRDNAVVNVFEDGDPGPLTVISHTDRNGVTRPYAGVDLNDRDSYYDGYKEPRALSFQSCSRALSGFLGEIEHPSFGAVLSDHDRALRGLLEDETTRYLTNNPLVLRTVTDADRRAELPMHHEMVGFVSDYSPQEDYQFRLDGTGWLKKKLARKTTAPEFWQDVFSRTDFQLLPDALFNKALPYIYGKVSDEASGGGTLYPRGTFDPGWLLLEADPVALAGPAAGSYVVYVSAITDGVESTVTRGALVFALNGSQQVDISFRTATPPTYYRVYFSDGVDDFNPFTNPTGGTFARYRDYLASDIPETGGKTLAEVVSDLNAAGATNSIHSNYAVIIGVGDSDRLQDYYDANGHVPSDFAGLADIIGAGDLNALMGGSRTVRIDSVTWGDDYVAVAGSVQGTGAAPTLYVGEETYGGVTRSAFLVCRFAVKDIVGAYVGGARQSSVGSATELEVPFLDDYATVFGNNYRDINGRRYTIVYATGQTAANAINGSKPITVNVWGIESNGDTTGTLLTSPVRQHQHFVRNLLASDAIPDTVWLTANPEFSAVPGLGLLNDDSYDAAQAAHEARLSGGYETAGIIGNGGEFESALDILASWQNDGDFDAGTNRLGQMYVSVEPFEAPDAADVLVLTDILDIEDRSFSARTQMTQNFWNVIPFNHTKDYTGATDSGWYLSGESRDAASITNYDQERTATTMDFRWLHAHTTQASDTILDVVKRKRTRFRHPIRTVTFTAPYLSSASAEIGSIIRLDHQEGIGAEGWSGHDVRVRRIDTQLDERVSDAVSKSYRRFECYDLGPIYDGLDDSDDPTQQSTALRNNASVIQLQQDVTNVRVDLTTVQAEIVTLDGRVTEAESDIVDLRTRGRVRVATTANITISTALNAGDTIDGVTLAAGDRVLVKNQSSAAENGIYEAGATPARTDQFSAYDDHPGALITVQEGTTNADTFWLCTSNAGGTLNSTALAFSSLSSIAAGALDDLSDVNAPTPSDGDVLTFDVGSGDWIPQAPSGSAGTVDNSVCSGRLTTETGVPVSASDRTAQGTIYFTPYNGNRLALYNGSSWVIGSFSELSLVLSSLTSAKNYDVFVDYNAGTPQLVLSAAWTNDTTRSDALALQDGVYVKSGTPTYRHIGTIRTTGTTTTEDSAAKRFVWNLYNRTPRPMQAALETADTWTYTTATWRQSNANAANQLDYVVGLNDMAVQAQAIGIASNTSAVAVSTAIGVDSTSTPGSLMPTCTNTGQISNVVTYWGLPGIGRHFLTWLEFSTASGTTTWRGDAGVPTRLQAGIVGMLWN